MSSLQLSLQSVVRRLGPTATNQTILEAAQAEGIACSLSACQYAFSVVFPEVRGRRQTPVLPAAAPLQVLSLPLDEKREQQRRRQRLLRRQVAVAEAARIFLYALEKRPMFTGVEVLTEVVPALDNLRHKIDRLEALWAKEQTA